MNARHVLTIGFFRAGNGLRARATINGRNKVPNI